MALACCVWSWLGRCSRCSNRAEKLSKGQLLIDSWRWLRWQIWQWTLVLDLWSRHSGQAARGTFLLWWVVNVRPCLPREQCFDVVRIPLHPSAICFPVATPEHRLRIWGSLCVGDVGWWCLATQYVDLWTEHLDEWVWWVARIAQQSNLCWGGWQMLLDRIKLAE